MPSPIPYRENAYVEDAKLLGYYLAEWRRGTSTDKVTLIRDVLGFSGPALLRWALITHARAHDALVWDRRRGAVIYKVTGPLTGTSGRTAEAFISGWELRDGSCAPRNVTVLLGRRQRR